MSSGDSLESRTMMMNYQMCQDAELLLLLKIPIDVEQQQQHPRRLINDERVLCRTEISVIIVIIGIIWCALNLRSKKSNRIIFVIWYIYVCIVYRSIRLHVYHRTSVHCLSQTRQMIYAASIKAN